MSTANIILALLLLCSVASGRTAVLPPGGDTIGAAIDNCLCIACRRDGTRCPACCPVTASVCTPKWHRCTRSNCCGGWACKRWRHGKRCEPKCVRKWNRCDRGNGYCCDGWRCVPWRYGRRCEPRSSRRHRGLRNSRRSL